MDVGHFPKFKFLCGDFFKMFEQAFPQQFEDTSNGLTLHIATYCTVKKRRSWHCFVSEDGAYLGYVIFHQRNSNLTPSSLLIHKNTLNDAIPIQEASFFYSFASLSYADMASRVSVSPLGCSILQSR